jgi:hypothetical protein
MAKTVATFMRLPAATRRKLDRLAERAQERYGGSRSLGRAVALLVEQADMVRREQAQREAS